MTGSNTLNSLEGKIAIVTGGAACLRWLRSRGCSDFRYQFAVGYEAGGLEDEEDDGPRG